MREMIQTENDYIRSLQLVIDHYLPEMSKDNLPHGLRGKRNVIFGNIEKIFEFHTRYFQSELQQCEQNPFSTGRIFMQHVSSCGVPRVQHVLCHSWYETQYCALWCNGFCVQTLGPMVLYNMWIFSCNRCSWNLA